MVNQKGGQGNAGYGQTNGIGQQGASDEQDGLSDTAQYREQDPAGHAKSCKACGEEGIGADNGRGGQHEAAGSRQQKAEDGNGFHEESG